MSHNSGAGILLEYLGLILLVIFVWPLVASIFFGNVAGFEQQNAWLRGQIDPYAASDAQLAQQITRVGGGW